MAPKTSLRDNPPTASSSSSSSEESGKGSESSEYETTDDEAAKINGKPGASSVKATPQPSHKKRQPSASNSKSDDDSGGNDAAEPHGKPDASSGRAPSSQAPKQRNTSDSSTNSDSESTDDDDAAKSSGKRPPSPPAKKKQQQPVVSEKPPQQQKREADKTPDPISSKRAKTEPSTDSENKKKLLESEKKTPFQRVWNDTDDIEILKGMGEYEEKKKVNPVHDANDFYEFVKVKIPTKFSKQQLLNKVQSIKRKFRSFEKRVSGGATLKPHEATIYEFSNKLWGPSVVSAETSLSNDNNNNNNVWYLSDTLGVCYKGGVDPDYLTEVMDCVDEEVRAKLEARWRKNQGAIARAVGDRAKITQDVCQLVDKHSSSSSSSSAR